MSDQKPADQKTFSGSIPTIPVVALLGLILVGWGLLAAAAPPSPPVEIDFTAVKGDVARQCDLLVDPSGRLTIDQVASPPWSDRFEPNGQATLKLGIVDGAAWVRFRISRPPGQTPRPLVLELSKHLVEKIDYYLPLADGGYRSVQAGVSRRPGDQMEASRTPALTLPADLPGGRYIYLRLESRFGLGFNLALYTQAGFKKHLVADSYLFGVLLGIPVALILFNLFIFLAFHDRTYLFYVLFTSSMLGYELLVYGLLKPAGNELDLLFMGLIAALALFFGTQFARIFLNSKQNAPQMDKLLLVYMALAVIRGLISLAGYHMLGNQMAQVLGLLSPILAISTGLICLRRGFLPARYYLLAWTFFSAGILWHVLVSFGFFAWSGLGSAGMALGSAAEAILLSFALADRFRNIRRESRTLEQVSRHYRRLSLIDELTGLNNKRFFSENYKPQVEAAVRANKPLSLMMIDIDDFKLFNDAYGHPQGDKMLHNLGMVISGNVRSHDAACRYGGEEFAVILPGAGQDQAWGVAERIRTGFGSISHTPSPKGKPVQASISLGVAQLGDGESETNLLVRADQALYQAKSDGKNRTVIAPPFDPTQPSL